MIDLNQRLCGILLNTAFVVGVFFLLLYVVHGELKLVEDSFIEDLVDKTIWLGQLIFKVGGIGNLP